MFAESNDGRLHTFLDSYPILPREIGIHSSEHKHPSIKIPNPLGIKRLRCGVHPEEETKADAYIAVFHHPFATRVDKQGNFKLEGLPSGKMEIAAWTPQEGAAEAMVLIEPRTITSTVMRLGP